MRAVNLLPPDQRRQVASGARGGSAYTVLVVLAAVLVAVVAYALAAHQAVSREAEAARITVEADRAEALVAEIAPFGELSQVREQRIAEIRDLALGRLDWERLTRELALVLPRETWLTSVEGSAAGESTGAPGTAEVTGAPTAGPTVALTGCAKSQPTVAKALVRLRRLDGASEIELQNSTKTDSAGGGSDVGGCARAYGFQATIQLDPPVPAALDPKGADRVPASLGGGS